MALPPNHHHHHHHHHVHGFNMFNYQDQQDNNIPSPSSLPSCPPHLFSSGGGNLTMKRSVSFSGMERSHDHQLDQGLNGEDDLSDDGSQLGEKKKRLNIEQVKALEKSFELANKLEPERKMQLAKALGLQPRQIAIWFQNRRARWKTKQLERDYEVLKKQFDMLKSDNDLLLARNNKLQAELLALKNGDSNEEDRKKDIDQNSWSNGSTDNSCENLNLHISNTKQQQSMFSTSMRPTANVTHDLLNEKSDQLQSLKVDQILVQDENYCNLFNGIDEQQGFWHWPDQHPSFSLHQPHFSSN